MQFSTDFQPSGNPILGKTVVPLEVPAGHAYLDHKIIRHNGAVVAFEHSKITIALTKAFVAVNGGQAAAIARIRELVETHPQASGS